MHLIFLRKSFRSPIPCGGTDVGPLFMAVQLNYTDSETLYMDVSQTCMSIAQFRATMRISLKIVWVTEWIESIPRIGLGPFDFVRCTGVLHYLKKPQKGLNIVNDAQSDHGGASLMVHGKYGRTGRTGVYQIQYLLHILNHNDQAINSELKNAKKLLEILQESHGFNHFSTNDHQTMGDIGIYDLLLHKRDVAYSLFDLYD